LNQMTPREESNDVTRRLATWMRESVPRGIDSVREANRLEDSIVVWIVGIAAGSLALLVAQQERLSESLVLVRIAAVLLGATIGFGVLARMLTRALVRFEITYFSRMEGKLAAFALRFPSDDMNGSVSSAELDKKREEEFQQLKDFATFVMGREPEDVSEESEKKEKEKRAQMGLWGDIAFNLCLTNFGLAGGVLIAAFFF